MFLVVRPGATSSVLTTSSDALVTSFFVSFFLLRVSIEAERRSPLNSLQGDLPSFVAHCRVCQVGRLVEEKLSVGWPSRIFKGPLPLGGKHSFGALFDMKVPSVQCSITSGYAPHD